MSDLTTTTAPVVVTPVVVAAPEKGTPEYNAQMAARYTEQFGDLTPKPTTVAAEIPAKPETGHDKFYDAKTGVYNWEAHAREVEFKKAKTGDEPVKTAEELAAEAAAVAAAGEVTAEGAEGMLTKAGLSPEGMRVELLRDGKLSDANYEASVKIFGKAMVDDYVEGVNSAKELAVYKTQDYVGGKESYDAIKAFGESLPANEKAEYNTMLASPNWKIAIDALRARMGSSKKTAGEPALLEGSGAADDVGFANQSEMVAAMSDPRYQPMSPKHDPAYARSVHAKVKAMTSKRG